MNIAFIGAGNVGAPLAERLARAGHRVQLAQFGEASESIERALARTSLLSASPVHTALGEADVVFLAVPFMVVGEMLPALAEALAGKVLVDCTNPIGPGLSHGLPEGSGSAMIQRLAPEARVVKSFSIYGFENLEEPEFPESPVRPAMLFCGDDESAKALVAPLIESCGFEPLDIGGLVQALHLEHMTLLWVRMVRMGGHTPHLAWSALRRPVS